MALTRREFSNRGATLRYWYRVGTKPQWVIFLHGGGSNHRTFDKQLETFDPASHLLLFDLRGQAESPLARGQKVDFLDVVDDVLKLMQLHEIVRATLVAHSFGANVALEFLYLYPEKVERLILIGCHSHHRKKELAERLRVARTWLRVRTQSWDTFVRYVSEVTSTDPTVRSNIEQGLRGINKDTFIQLGLSRHKRMRLVEYSDPPPTLLIRGENEYSDAMDTINASILATPGCRSVVIEDAGHSCHEERPADVNRHIAAFLGTTS